MADDPTVEAPVSIVDTLTVRELLDVSCAAHQRYRDAVERRVPDGASTQVVSGDIEAVGAALLQACRYRVEAHARDPKQADPAWHDQPLTYEHDALLTFYASQLSR